MIGGAELRSRILLMAPANLVRFFPLDELSGTNCRDLSNNNQTVTYNGPTLKSRAGYDGMPTPDFDGSNDNIDTITNLSTDFGTPDTGSMFMAFWISEADASSGTFRHTVSIRDNVNNSEVDCLRWGSVAYQMRPQVIMQGEFRNVTMDITGKTNQWNTICITWDSSDVVKGWLNGVKVSNSSTFTNTWGTGGITHSKIGSRPESNSQWWKGGLGIVAWWKTVLPEAKAETLRLPNRM